MAEDHNNRRIRMRREKIRRIELIRAKECPESDEAQKWGWYLRRLERKSNGKNREGMVQARIRKKPKISEKYKVEPQTSYGKCIDHVVDALDMNRTDAEYALKTIGASYELIFLAYSMHINNSMGFRNAINIVSRCEFTQDDIEIYRNAHKLAKSEGMKIGEAIEILALTGYESFEKAAKPRKMQEAQNGLNLGQLLGPILPVAFSDLSEKERKELTYRLYGEPIGDIGRILEQSLEEDI